MGGEGLGAGSKAIALEMRAIRKTFGGIAVLEDVSFDLRRGEVHALLGENGAGKSTLMNILTGIYSADAGGIRLAGEAVAIRSPADALARGIGMVHQHFRLAKPFTARENVRLAAGALAELRSDAAVQQRIGEVLDRTGLEVRLEVPIEQLSVAEQQRVEVLKALSLGARILVLDEPTAVLTDAESDRLLQLVRDLADAGYAIIFITHKLREVTATGDRVSTLRRGRMVMSGRDVESVEIDELSRAMVGERDLRAPERQPRAIGEPLLQLTGFEVADAARVAVRDIDLKLCAGQIVGIAGVGGNGQQELAEAIVGLRPASAGQMHLGGRDVTQATVRERRLGGARFVPSDRAAQALAPNLSLNENLTAAEVRGGRLGSFLLSAGAIARRARKMIDGYEIDGRGSAPIRLLSGGNAQKAILARELDDHAKVIIAHSPTRGLDVAACRYVHDRLIEAAERGSAILLISEDLEEIIALSDAIHVMSRGRLNTTAGGLPSRTEIGELMLGHA